MSLSACLSDCPRILIACGLAAALGLAQATDKQTIQWPGVHRTQIGAVQVIALSDRRMAMDASRFKNVALEDLPKAVSTALQSEPDLRGVTAYVVKSGGKTVLIDTGRGQEQGQDLGQVVENMKSAGIPPEEISAIFLTHMHRDQVGGLVDGNGEKLFKNAQLYASVGEMRYWLEEHNFVMAPDEDKPAFATTIKNVMRYVKAGKLKPVEAGPTSVLGLSMVPLPGHTPGSVGYLIESSNQTMLIVGDQSTANLISACCLGDALDKDSDAKRAEEQWRKLLRKAVSGNWLIADSYLPFPGIGRVRAKGWDKFGYESILSSGK